jgi:hypothetical protein
MLSLPKESPPAIQRQPATGFNNHFRMALTYQ